jgi:hypothetical protein
MLDYQSWELHNLINEANEIIDFYNEDLKAEVQSQLPHLEYLYKRNGEAGAAWFIEEERQRNSDPKFNSEKAGIRRCLLVSYKEESKRQGINNPASVVVNKLMHRVFNYDDIQDKITELLNQGKLDCCEAVDIRLALKDKLFEMVKKAVLMLDFPLKMFDGVNLGKEDIVAAHMRAYRRDIDYLQAERRQSGCGSCGGARAGAIVRKHPPQKPSFAKSPIRLAKSIEAERQIGRR